MGRRAAGGPADLWSYPRSWRDRYGDDVEMYLRDRYGDGPLPVSARLSLFRSGTVERLRSGGIIGTSAEPDLQVRGASLLVLYAWVMFVFAGSAFAKYTEHWPLVTPQVDRRLPAAAMGAVQASSLAGTLILISAAAVALPALARLVRSDGWRPLWALLRPLAVAVTVAGVAGTVIVVWNNHLGPAAITAPLSLQVAGVVAGLLVLGALAVGCGTVVALVYRLRLSHRVTRAFGLLALAMAAVLVLIFAGVLTWWISTAEHAPWFFGSLAPRSPSSPAPLAMIVLCLMMLSALVLAGIGTVRIVDGLSRADAEPAYRGGD